MIVPTATSVSEVGQALEIIAGARRYDAGRSKQSAFRISVKTGFMGVPGEKSHYPRKSPLEG